MRLGDRARRPAWRGPPASSPLIDTAGIKKKGRLKGSIEFYSQARSQTAIRRADVVLMMVDVTAEISRVDKKIAETIAGESKACILVVNKWDLTQGRVATEAYADYATSRLPGLSYAPIIFTTARDGRNIQSTIDLAQHLFKQARHRVGTGELNRWLEAVQRRRQVPSF